MDTIKGFAVAPYTLNEYGYCWGNPEKYVDLNGKEPGEWTSGEDGSGTFYSFAASPDDWKDIILGNDVSGYLSRADLESEDVKIFWGEEEPDENKKEALVPKAGQVRMDGIDGEFVDGYKTPYTRYIDIPITTQEGKVMSYYAEQLRDENGAGIYNLYARNCGMVAQDILRMGGKILLSLCAIVVLVAGLGALIVYRNRVDIYKSQQNIFFMEYENEYEKEDTIIFKYDQIKDEVVELGRVEGYFRDCVINEEETVITGILSQKMIDKEYDVVRYDIVNGTVEFQNIDEKVDELITGNAKEFNVALVYDEGNKILITYDDENGDRWWLLYDYIAAEYDTILQEESRITNFLTIHNNNLWYKSGEGSLYQYDLETRIKTKIMDSVDDAVVAPDIGLVAYTKDMHCKKIYLYDINTQRTKCIARGGWNICYGDLSYTNAGWSNDSRQFFYIKSFSGLFNESTERLMIYDVKTSNTHCIYKENMTLHEFRYIVRR